MPSTQTSPHVIPGAFSAGATGGGFGRLLPGEQKATIGVEGREGKRKALRVSRIPSDRPTTTPPFKKNFDPKIIDPRAIRLWTTQALPFQFRGLLGQDLPLAGKSQVHRFNGFMTAQRRTFRRLGAFCGSRFAGVGALAHWWQPSRFLSNVGPTLWWVNDAIMTILLKIACPWGTLASWTTLPRDLTCSSCGRTRYVAPEDCARIGNKVAVMTRARPAREPNNIVKECVT